MEAIIGDLWKDSRVAQLTNKSGALSFIASSAVDWHVYIGEKKAFLKKKRRVYYAIPALAKAFEQDSARISQMIVDTIGKPRKAANFEASRANAAEVVENYPDGTPKARYVTNEQGKRDGRYASFHPNGNRYSTSMAFLA